MKDKYKKEILEEISKSGLPTEIETAKIIKKKGFSVVHGVSFVDQQKRELRSIDLYAEWYGLELVKKIENIFSENQIKLEIYIECKKSNKSKLVFYCGRPSTKSKKDFMLTHEEKKSSVLSYLSSALESYTTGSVLPRISKEIAISHNVVRGSDFFFEAQMQVLKCIHDRIEFISYDKEMIVPLIVFDGTMCKYIYDKDEPDVEEIDYITYLSNGLSFDPIPTLIDVVTLKGLPDYIDRLRAIYETLPRDKKMPDIFLY